jgi:hypothetical protein
MAGKNDLVCVRGLSIEGQAFERGDVLGLRDKDGVLKSKVKGVDRGHLEARLRNKLIQVGPLVDSAPAEAERPKDPPEGTALPEGFPAKAELEKAGVKTVEALMAMEPEAVQKVKGVGEATYDAIEAALADLRDGE